MVCVDGDGWCVVCLFYIDILSGGLMFVIVFIYLIIIGKLKLFEILILKV